MASFNTSRTQVSSKAEAAMELGYPAQRVFEALESHHFVDAGELVMFLSDEERNLPYICDDDIVEKEMDKAKGTVVKCEPDSFLYKETLAIYVAATCLLCKNARRSILTLPCCHVNLCKRCSYMTGRCPISDCKKDIEATINVFLS